ncbi:hypothetical protein ACB092_01G223900 [Castanea dentata]
MDGSFGVRKGAWTEEEDIRLKQCIEKYGEGKWHLVPVHSGLNRCRKSCRLRWLNYLKPNIKRGNFSADEVDLMLRLHKLLGNRWSLIAGRLPGRTANDVKNYWNTHLLKKGSSHITKLKEKPQDMVKVNVIKPQPRTLSKNLTCLNGKPAILGSFQKKEDIREISQTSMQSESRINWWESLSNCGVLDERATCTQCGTLNEVPKETFSTEEIVLDAKVVGDTLDEDVLNYWGDLSLDMVKVNVIKPQPRTFSKNLTWLSGKPAIVGSFQKKEDIRDISQTSMQSESRINWWESLSNCRELAERVTCTQCGRLNEVPKETFWAEEIVPEAKVVGDTLDEDVLNYWGDLSLDMDLWEVLNAE